MTAPFLRTLGVALALPLLLAACLFPSLTRSSGWQTSETFNRTYDQVWEAVLEGVKKDGFFWEIADADKDNGTIETEWRVRNLRKVGGVTRRRMEVEILSKDDGYAVKVRVFRERVFNARPYDVANPDEADWRWDGHDKSAATGFFNMIHPSLRDDG